MTPSLISCLQVAPMMARVDEGLSEAYTLHRLWDAADKDALLAEIGGEVRAVLCTGESGCSRALMETLPKLEMIANFGVGYDAVDIAAARERGIRVSNTPDVLSDAVAELALGLMLALCRRIPQADRFVRGGQWPAGGFGLTAELTGKTAGILGLGRIGKEIAQRLQAMKMQVVYHGRTRQAHIPYPYYDDLTAMARDVDWLIVIAPGSAETAGLVSRDVLEALGPSGALVNVARGSLVDEPALIDLLRSGGLGGAALDVFAAEPTVPEALWTMDNVVLSPHQGSATHKTRDAMADLVLGNLAAHFAGRPLLTPVA